MLAGKRPRPLALTILLGLGLLMVAGTTEAAPGPESGGPVPILDGGRLGHTVALPSGERTYRAEGKARAVSVLDPRTGAVLKTIPTAFRVDLLALSEDNRWLYGMSPRAEAIVVIDVSSDRVVGTIRIDPAVRPSPDAL